MANYIKSNDIKAFPLSARKEAYNDSYLLSEENLTRIIKLLYARNNSSFLIKDTFSAPFPFVINGHYFELTSLNDIISYQTDKKDLYATLYISNELHRVAGFTPTEESSYFKKYIVDTDNGNFIGLYFSETIPQINETNFSRYSLKILDKGVLHKEALIDYLLESSVVTPTDTLNLSTAKIKTSDSASITPSNLLTDITFSENNRVLEISVTKGKDK